VIRPQTWIAAAAAVAAVALTAPAAPPPNLGRALEAQRHLAAERPDDAAVWNDLGNLLALAGDVGGAEAAYRRSVELSPAAAAAHFNLALLLEQRGEREEAMGELRRVLEIDPAHAWASYQLGRLHEGAGDEKRAVRYYGQAFALEPRLAFPEYNPQVIENRLVAEAMLRGYRPETAPPQAPKIYQDPARIAGLLLPPVGAREAAAGAAVGAGGETGAAAAPTVLSGEDLDERGGVNQATPQAGGRYKPPRPAPVRTRTGARTWTRPPAEEVEGQGEGGMGSVEFGIGVPGPAPETGDEEGMETPREPRVQTAPGRVIFRPGVASTGRLDLELIPPARERAG
jgi:Flp pilus assembly protein TadD